MIKIWGVEQPRGEFIGYTTQWDHDIKWVRLISNNIEVQNLIESNIHYPNTFEGSLYRQIFIDTPNEVLTWNNIEHYREVRADFYD